MSVKPETIAITSTNLTKKIINITKELKAPNKDTNKNTLRKELTNLEKENKLLTKKIENKIYKITEKTNPETVLGVLLCDNFIIVDGLTLVNDTEFQEIGKYLGYDHYKVQPYAYFLTIYFYNDDFEEAIQ